MKIVKDKDTLSMVSDSIQNISEYKFYKGQLERAITELGGHLQGCSCIQIGRPVRAFTVRNPRTKEYSYVFNPNVKLKLGIRLSYEGCLSCNNRHFVTRPLFVLANWEDENGKKVTKFLGPKKSRIFMHEMDHLNGKVIGN